MNGGTWKCDHNGTVVLTTRKEHDKEFPGAVVFRQHCICRAFRTLAQWPDAWAVGTWVAGEATPNVDEAGR